MATAFACGPLAVKHESALVGQVHTEAQDKLGKIQQRFQRSTRKKQEEIIADFGWSRDRSYMHPDGLSVNASSSKNDSLLNQNLNSKTALSDLSTQPDRKSATASDEDSQEGKFAHDDTRENPKIFPAAPAMDPLAEKAQIEAQSKLEKISRRFRHVTKSKQEKIKADFGWRKDRSYIHPDGLYVLGAPSLLVNAPRSEVDPQLNQSVISQTSLSDSTALPDGKSATASNGSSQEGLANDDTLANQTLFVIEL